MTAVAIQGTPFAWPDGGSGRRLLHLLRELARQPDGMTFHVYLPRGVAPPPVEGAIVFHETRFHAEGTTASVKVRFQPGQVSAESMGQPEQLELDMPQGEIRRIWPVRKGHEHGQLKDLRTETEHRCDAHGFDLGSVLAAWVRHRVFGSEALE